MTQVKATKIEAIRGMNDLLPEISPYWQQVEAACRKLAQQYDYAEIRFPIVEKTALFQRTIGQTTDIVEKEMYTFTDRNGDSLSLRPEGTASCVRAGIEQGLLYNQVRRLWYLGPMFRHERPQKGRYRQFHQFGMEAFGMAGPDIDVEQLLVIHRLFQQLGLRDKITLEINSLGASTCRAQYRQDLVQYLSGHYELLDEDSQRRLSSNPLRILDSKNPAMQQLICEAPTLFDYLDQESRDHFEGLRHLLDVAKVPYRINPRLVRGLDYYGKTVYEWVTHELGAQGTVCAGGRYDNLVSQLGGKATPAVGFSLGLERLILLYQSVATCQVAPQVYVVLASAEAVARGMMVAEELRQALPWLRVVVNLSPGSLKSQFKRADKSGARWAVVLGEQELQDNLLSIKDLRGEHAQKQMTVADFRALLQKQPMAIQDAQNITDVKM